MTISPFPTPTPSRSQAQDVFDAAVEAFLTQLPTFVSEANALAVAMNLNSTTDTSASSNAVGTGAKTFTVTAGKSFQPGMWLVIADTAAPTTNGMFAQVTSYSGTTLVVNSYAVMGSGTKTAWVISQSAPAALEGLYALVAGSASQTFSVAAATAAAHAVRLDQIGGAEMQSGTFTATGTGFATPPTATVTYKIMNGMCFLNIPQSSISGTSNATTFTITGIPAAVQPSVLRYSQILLGSNNGATISNIYANISGGTITLGVNGDPNAWAAANNKGLYTTTITYML